MSSKMPIRHPLAPAFAKVERAETHIKDLNTAVSAFFEGRPYRIVSNLNEQGTEDIWSIAVEPISLNLECLAADAVHNLRTPLDKMLAAGFRSTVLHKPRSKIERLKFPFVDHINDMKRVMARLEEHLSAPVIEFLCDSEPYKGGAGQMLWALNQLDNRDKHRALLEPLKLSFTELQLRRIQTYNGFPLRFGSRRGRHLVPAPDAKPGAWHMQQPQRELRPIRRLRPPSVTTYLEFTSPHDDMEILATTPGTKVDADMQPSLYIGFSGIEILEGEHVIKALETMRQAVLTVINDFQRRFF